VRDEARFCPSRCAQNDGGFDIPGVQKDLLDLLQLYP